MLLRHVRKESWMTSNSHRSAPSNAGGYHDAESKSLPVTWRFLPLYHNLKDVKSKSNSTHHSRPVHRLQESSKGTDNGEKADTSLGSSASELRL